MPAQAWVQLIIGAAATLGALITWRQKNTADRRGEWWRRAAWAFERSFSDKETEAELGWRLLESLTKSRLVTTGDSDVVQIIAEHVVFEEFDDNEGRQSAGATE